MDPYRVAYEEAAAELNEIAARYVELASRKERLEKLIAAFRPLVEAELEAVQS
jgi:hypothetical protein